MNLFLVGLFSCVSSHKQQINTTDKVSTPELVRSLNYSDKDEPSAQPYIPPSFTLLRVVDVEGRQGVAVDKEHYYVSGSKSLHKYKKDGVLVMENKEPFKMYKTASNHIGDIDYFKNEIYVGVEWFEDGVGRDIQIAVHDAETLKFKRSFPFEKSSGQLEVSGVAVDRENARLWLCSWVGGESGEHLYEYDLKNGAYLRKIKMSEPPEYLQGVYFYNGNLYLTADDGDADSDEYDNLYRVSLDTQNLGEVNHVKEFTEVKKAGEIEGLAFDPFTGEFVVHFNRGKRIVAGMPKGLYPGYKTEIHELYIFQLADDDSD